MKSKDWLNRHKNDFFVNKSLKEGYFSRAAYKLLEIDKKYKFIEKSKNILEIGSAPGSWSQVVVKNNSNANLFAFDLLDMKFTHTKIKFYKEDFLKFDYTKLPLNFDLILSDIAPNTTGHQSTDHLRIASMILDIILIINKISSPSSSFVFKIWKGSEEVSIVKLLKTMYEKVSYFKPKSSRSESSEIFIVAEKFIL
ncbi:RlmE family RNA methyltransferase [Alphaproteobacteria bacterium]|nr:RlmE family RNA methyltransferase [Alphaproteobacteria bacterium]